MTDTTPALDRATEALVHPPDPYRANTPNATVGPIIAREVLSAALADPDDDVIERAIRVYLALYGLPANYSSPYQALSPGRTHRDVAEDIAPALADAIRAAILGESA